MLLVVTSRCDLTADWLIIELERRGASFVRFNTEDYPTRVRLTWRPDGAVLDLAASSQRVCLDDITAVWYRRPVPPRLVAREPDLQDWAVREAREALDALWQTTDALWVNRPDRNQLAGYKPEQLRRARSLGFLIPETIMTNDGAAASAFLCAHALAIAKPLNRGRVHVAGRERGFFTSFLNPAARAEASHLGSEPYLFQELVDKSYDVRVTVIGDEAFAARIDSQSHSEGQVDWRRAPTEELPHAVETLPADLAAMCVQLTRSYGLSFAAIDLARRPDGEYVFFELNPNGQWAWIERLTQLPLRSRLSDLLIR